MATTRLMLAMASLLVALGCGAAGEGSGPPSRRAPLDRNGPDLGASRTQATSPAASSAPREEEASDRPSGALARPAPSGSPPQEEDSTPATSRARFLAVGDIMLSRQVGAKIADARDPMLPFRPLGALLHSVDFCFGNLESPFSSSDWIGRGPAHIFNTPPGHIEGLVAHNFKLLNLANNHALDQGLGGLRFTLRHLAEHGIESIGAGETPEQAWAGAVLEVNGIRIGFLGASYASVNDNGSLRSPYVARIDDLGRLERSVTTLRDRSDFVVVTMHAGAEYNPRVVRSQIDFARAAVDAGAELVIGAHPHVVQRVERYRDRWVLYSLGNFIFDHEPLPTRQSLAAQVTLSRTIRPNSTARATLVEIALIPIMIEQRAIPRLATEQEAQAILALAGVDGPILPGELGSP